MTQFLEIVHVVALHDQEAPPSLIDHGKLESAVGQVSQTWGGEYLYATLVEQAAVLLFGVCAAHAFADGNKRTAWLACTTFLEVNGVELVEIEQREVEDFVASVVEDHLAIADVVDWLLDRI